MRIVVATLALSFVGAILDDAKADPYRWCAQYSGKASSTNCYFVTLGQCQAAVSGVGGFCSPNPYFSGSDGSRRRTRRHY
jgi:hypothetical protein